MSQFVHLLPISSGSVTSLVAACVCWSVLAWPVAATHAESQDVLGNLVLHATGSPDGRLAFTFVRDDLMGETRDLPIGVFDSGIGGLTVLEAILAIDAFDNSSLKPGPDGRPDFEAEQFVYLGDQANMPYGNYPRRGNETYLRELILKDAVFLLGRRFWPTASAKAVALDKPPVKAIVIACNTATAYGLEDIRTALSRWRVPVFAVGVVEAGARGVLQAHGTNGAKGAVAILATVGTCDSMAYPKAIAAAFGRTGMRSPSLIQHGCADLPAAIEGDPAVTSRLSIDEVIAADLRELLVEHRESGATIPIDSVVLGCTHFPLVRERILAGLQSLRDLEENGERPFDQLIAPQIDVIDPAGLVARELFRTLALNRARAPERKSETGSISDRSPPRRSDRFFISVPSDRLAGGWSDESKKFVRPTNRLDVEDTRVIPLQPELLPATSRDMIRKRLPNVWRSLGW